jgi:uncharacterized protein HemX
MARRRKRKEPGQATPKRPTASQQETPHADQLKDVKNAAQAENENIRSGGERPTVKAKKTSGGKVAAAILVPAAIGGGLAYGAHQYRKSKVQKDLEAWVDEISPFLDAEFDDYGHDVI